MHSQYFSRYFSSSSTADDRHPKWSGILCAAFLASAILLGGCADAGGPLDPDDFYSEPGTTEVVEPIEFTDQNYDFKGETGIADLRQIITMGNTTNQRYWYGFSPEDPYPAGDERRFGENCNPFQDDRFPEPLQELSELPTTIEGVVTLHPRYFQKLQVCGQDQRFYGVYYLQDETGGIMVLKDSRISDFTFGDRVRLRVRGIYKSYDTYAVLIWDEQEIVDPGTKYPIYYEDADGMLGDNDLGEVRRVRGEIISEPTNINFNEMHLRAEDGTKYVVSVDRELAQRNINLKDGVEVEVTGPVINSYSEYTVLVMGLGQIKWIDSSDED